MPVFVGTATSSFMLSNGIGLPRLSTTERNALSGANLHEGQIIYNSTLNKIEFYNGSAWNEVSTPFGASGGNAANGTQPGNGYKYHSFTSPGTFTVTAGTTDAEVLVVGGGGGGGAHNNGGSDGGGGGGAGGVVLAPAVPLSPGTYNITVGNGGSGGSENTVQNSNPGCRNKNAPFGGDSGDSGGNSVFGASSPSSIQLTAIGGGGGGSGPNAGNQDCGGSGGGAGSGGSPVTNGAAGNQPSQNPSFSGPKAQYGHPGGNAPAAPLFLGAGGGGAGGAGGNGSSGGPGIGGPAWQAPAGFDASLIGVSHGQGRYYGGGGTGGNQNNVTGSPAGVGTGGGGRGHSANSGPNAGAANGSGGAGGCGQPAPGARSRGANGGTGLVVIRYAVS